MRQRCATALSYLQSHRLKGLAFKQVKIGVFFFHGATALIGQGVLIIEESRSRSRHIELGRTPLDE